MAKKQTALNGKVTLTELVDAAVSKAADGYVVENLTHQAIEEISCTTQFRKFVEGRVKARLAAK